jgi:hypothetical protein
LQKLPSTKKLKTHKTKQKKIKIKEKKKKKQQQQQQQREERRRRREKKKGEEKSCCVICVQATTFSGSNLPPF